MTIFSEAPESRNRYLRLSARRQVGASAAILPAVIMS